MYFPGNGVLRTIYLTILTTHTTLAVTVPVLAIITLRRGLKGWFQRASQNRALDFADLAVRERHRRGGVFDAIPDIEEGLPMRLVTWLYLAATPAVFAQRGAVDRLQRRCASDRWVPRRARLLRRVRRLVHRLLVWLQV